MPSEQRITSYSSQYGDDGGFSLSLCCKFEITESEIVYYLAGGDEIVVAIKI